MSRTRLYEGRGDGAPLFHVRLHPQVLLWIRTEKGYGWARAFLEAAYERETGQHVPFPNKSRPDRVEPPKESVFKQPARRKVNGKKDRR